MNAETAVFSPFSRWRRHWEFFRLMVRRDLKVRYAGSTLGALWNLIHPVVMILIYIVIFSTVFAGGRVAGGEGTGNYAAHLCSGMIVWLVFAECLGRSVTTLVDNSNFLQKVSFPPLILHASILFNVLLIYGFGFLALIALLKLFGYSVGWAALGVLPLLILVGAAAMGLGLILSAMHVFFRDTSQLVAIVLQVGFWFNPIVYPKSLLENSPWGNWAWMLSLNPVEHFVSTAQAYFDSSFASPWKFAPVVIVLFPAVCLALGLRIFRRTLPEVRDGL